MPIPIKFFIAKKVGGFFVKKIAKTAIKKKVGGAFAPLKKVAKVIPPKAWAAIILVITLIVTHFGAYMYGKRVERNYQEQRIEAALQELKKEAERIQREETRIIEERQQSEQKVVERIREIQIDVPTPQCIDLDDDWLREYNRAISAATDS